LNAEYAKQFGGVTPDFAQSSRLPEAKSDKPKAPGTPGTN
jgi:hypothetical protein